MSVVLWKRSSVFAVVFIMVFLYFSPAQVSMKPFVSAGQNLTYRVQKLDSVLTGYYRESIKAYLDEIGEFDISRRNLRYWRDFYNNRVHLQYEQPITLSRQSFTARLDLQLKKNWFIRCEAENKALNPRSGIFLFFKKEFQ
jgi:hypothetical protein